MQKGSILGSYWKVTTVILLSLANESFEFEDYMSNRDPSVFSYYFMLSTEPLSFIYL